MTPYIGIKQVEATPEAQEGQHGYKVVYPDGYVSWSPMDAFEDAYASLNGAEMSFAMAVHMLMQGYEVSRPSYQGCPISLVVSNGMAAYDNGEEAEVADWIGINIDDVIEPYTPSHSDMMANDWFVVD